MLLQVKSNRAIYDILVLLLSYPEKRANLSSERVYVDEDDEEKANEKSVNKEGDNREECSDNHSPIEGDDCYNVFHFLLFHPIDIDVRSSQTYSSIVPSSHHPYYDCPYHVCAVEVVLGRCI